MHWRLLQCIRLVFDVAEVYYSSVIKFGAESSDMLTHAIACVDRLCSCLLVSVHGIWVDPSLC